MRFDVAICGGGIVGVATALKLAPLRVLVLEKEERIASHQTGHNSGVIHAGLYYKPGSLKATLCALGRDQLMRFCAERGVPYERCGKLVVATHPRELPRLDELERRGRANGLRGIVRLRAEQIAEHEPHATGVGALLVPETAIVDYVRVTRAFADVAEEQGTEIVTSARVLRMRQDAKGVVIETTRGEYACAAAVNCAGLHCDRLARACGATPRVHIIPFRGEYCALREERRSLVRNLIYPVPDPRFPFLGVHFTRRISGEIEAGPNAILALAREGYTGRTLSPCDVWESVSFGGFWRMARAHYATGIGEMFRSWNRRAFANALRALVPEVREDDLVPAGAGVRAQAVDEQGALVDDFSFLEQERIVHVLNAPSPAATASLAIAESIAERVRPRLS